MFFLPRCSKRTLVTALPQFLENLHSLVGCQILVQSPIDLHHRRPRAAGQAFNVFQAEFTVLADTAMTKIKLAFDCGNDLLRTTDMARDVATNLHVVLTSGLPVVHGIESHHAHNV